MVSAISKPWARADSQRFPTGLPCFGYEFCRCLGVTADSIGKRGQSISRNDDPHPHGCVAAAREARQTGRCTKAQLSEALRSSPVVQAEPSPAAKRKAKKKCTDDGLPVQSFRTLLADLATLTRNVVRCGKAPEMALLARPTEIQQRAFDLLGIKLTA